MRGKAARTRQEPPLRSLLGGLASLRDVSIEAVTEAHKRRLLTFPDYRGERCWRFGDERNGCFRRLDGQPFTVGKDHTKTLSEREGPQWHLPIGMGEILLNDRSDAICVEGAPDGLAVFHFADAEGQLSSIGVLVLLGEGTRIAEQEARKMSGRRVRIIPDATDGGFDAGDRWAEAFAAWAKEVQILDLRGLRRDDGHAVKDLNDCTRIDADDFEANRELWSICNLDSRGPRVRLVQAACLLDLTGSSLGDDCRSNRETETTETQSNRETDDTQILRDSEGGGGRKENVDGESVNSLQHSSPSFSVEKLIEGTIPANHGETNSRLFRLARRIKREAELTGVAFGPLIRQAAIAWFEKARGRTSLSAEDVEVMLERKVEKVRSVGNLFEDALRTLDSMAPVEHAGVQGKLKLERLVRLCREMGKAGEFSLSTRQAAGVISSKDASMGMDYLWSLENLGIIECTQRGKQGGGKASRYKYKG
jgi:hypothetical protein